MAALNDPILISFLFLLLGLVIGGLTGWLVAKFRLYRRAVEQTEVEASYVRRELHENLERQADILRDDLREKEEELKMLTGRLAGQEQLIAGMEEKLFDQKQELERLQERFRQEFENVANRLLEEKSRKFTDQNQRQLQDLLEPLREKIKTFEAGVERRFLEETKDRVSLKKEIEHLRLLNQQLSQDATNLADALKGENKTQGDWGEWQLELLLERAGLAKGVHYQVQPSYTDQDGRRKRPDVVINLPENKHLIIDSKVSLVAYEQFFNATEEADRRRYLRAHLDSLRRHVRELGRKNYQQLEQLYAPEYLLLFVPVEPAFTAALREDNRLFLDALDQNIVLVSTSTLLATLRTVAFIWKQEKQKRNVLEIARQSGLLYDKLCNFVADLQAVGQRLDQARQAHHQAMNRLLESRRYGDTLLGRAERIRELGAKTSKLLPKELLPTEGEEEE